LIRMLRFAAALLLAPVVVSAQSAETGFLNRTVTVGGAQYRYQVYLPANYSVEQAWPVILYLHGVGERGNDGLRQTLIGLPAAIRTAAARYPAIVVMPQVPPDSNWIGTPGDAAMAALDRTLAEFRTDSARVYLTGLSMGGNGAWNLAYRFPERFAALVAVCGFVSSASPAVPGSRPAVPTDGGDAFATLARRLGTLPVWIAHGEIDPVVPVSESRRAAEALRAAGGNVRYVEYPGIGHGVWEPTYASPQLVGWLFAQRRPR
jgi:predicted peptidase